MSSHSYKAGESLATWITCPKCVGMGLMSAVTDIECAACHGSGKVLGVRCLACDGTGRQSVEIDALCGECNGIGYVARPENHSSSVQE
jgi:DnaJ-class molecular chaperone